MMYRKALTFNDVTTARDILFSSEAHPRVHKKLGREVSGFNYGKWREVCEEVVYGGNILKFTQNDGLRRLLLSTENRLLVEASPADRLWGIGFTSETAANNAESWGENLLGKVLMRVRRDIARHENTQPRCEKYLNLTSDNEEHEVPIRNVAMSGQLQWKHDSGWSKPMVETKGRERFDEIDTWLYGPGLLCRIYGGEYIFVDTSNYWCNLASPEAMSRVNTLVGILNATVNIEKSMRAFLKYIIKRCNVNVGKPIPTSVCIGTRRLEITVDDERNVISFSDCRPLLENVSRSANPLVKSVCIMPIDTDAIPTEFQFPGKGEIIHYLMRVFPDARELVTIMWHIGNSLIDPISRPKSIMLCGPGGSGKSKLLQLLFACMAGCCNILPDGSLTGNARAMPSEVAEVIASSRMAVCYDVNLEKDRLNMAVFKNISGSDYIRVGFNSCKTNCSLMLATNGIIDIKQQPDYHTDAIMRRVVCILMNVAALAIPETAAPEDQESRLDFICSCIHTRLRYESMPVSPMSLLLTLCASEIDTVLEYVEETSEPITIFDGTGVLRILSSAVGHSPASVVFKAKLVSPTVVFELDGYTLLRGLKLRAR